MTTTTDKGKSHTPLSGWLLIVGIAVCVVAFVLARIADLGESLQPKQVMAETSEQEIR